MTYSRSDVYKLLFKIEDEKNVDVSEYVDMLGTTDDIPGGVIDFLKSKGYVEYPEKLFINLKNKPLTKSLKSFLEGKISDDEKAKLLSSYLTHYIIELESLEDESERFKLFDDFKIEQLLSSLLQYLGLNQSAMMTEFLTELGEQFKSYNII